MRGLKASYDIRFRIENRIIASFIGLMTTEVLEHNFDIVYRLFLAWIQRNVLSRPVLNPWRAQKLNWCVVQALHPMLLLDPRAPNRWVVFRVALPVPKKGDLASLNLVARSRKQDFLAFEWWDWHVMHTRLVGRDRSLECLTAISVYLLNCKREGWILAWLDMGLKERLKCNGLLDKEIKSIIMQLNRVRNFGEFFFELLQVVNESLWD